MRVLALSLVLLVAAFAGCAEAPTTKTATEAAGGVCPKGNVAVGMDAKGAPICERTALLDQTCPTGQTAAGLWQDGTLRCIPVLSDPTPPAKRPPPEVSSNLKIAGVYGQRNDTTTSNIDHLKMYVELAAGAAPMDLTTLIVRLSDGTTTYDYAYGHDGGKGFRTEWIRGTNNSAVMHAGDLVEIELWTWPALDEITTRTSISLTLLPETGSPVTAHFRTPATYGSDKVITLR